MASATETSSNSSYDGSAVAPAEKRRRSAAISRKLRMLRAHGLIHKLPHTHRYRVCVTCKETMLL